MNTSGSRLCFFNRNIVKAFCQAYIDCIEKADVVPLLCYALKETKHLKAWRIGNQPFLLPAPPPFVEPPCPRFGAGEGLEGREEAGREEEADL